MAPMSTSSTQSHSQSPSKPMAWTGRGLVLAGIVFSAFNLRTAVTSLTPLLEQLGAHFGFSSTMAGVFGMLPTAAFALFGALTPRVAKVLGLERTALLAMLLAAAGLFSRAVAGNTGTLLATSIIALAGMGIGNIVLPPLVKRYFPDRVGTVSTAYITVLQLGTILPALVAVPLAAAAGWSVSLGSWGAFALIAALPWVALLWVERRKDAALALTHDQAVTTADEAPELMLPTHSGNVWRSPVACSLRL